MSNSLAIEFISSKISELTGLKLAYYKDELLQEAFTSVMEKNSLSSLVELGVAIKKRPEIVDQIFGALTVNYTTLFRGRTTWKYLRDNLSKKGSPTKILHLACSTGEEVLSTQILSRMIGKPLKVVASDVDFKAVEIAKSGRIDINHKSSIESGLQRFNPTLKFQTYFYDKKDYLLTRESLISDVEFHVHDAIDSIPWTEQDIIFCRNMLIYLEEEYKTIVLDNIYKALKPGGWLILGNLDGFLIDDQDFRFEIVDSSAKVYSKRS